MANNQNIEAVANAEYAVIGGLMLDDKAIHRISDLREEDFLLEDARLLFQSIKRLAKAGMAYDAVTMEEHLSRAKLLTRVGGFGKLIEIVNATPGAANIQAYARVVKDHAVGRQIRAECMHVAQSGAVGDEAVAMAHRIAESARGSAQAHSRGVSSVLKDVMAGIEQRLTGQSDETVPTGIADLDAMLGGGLARAELIIIAGRPSMGKTVLAAQIARHIARSQPSLFISIEQKDKALGQRLLAAEARVHMGKLKDPIKLESDEWSKLTTATASLADSKLHFVDTGAVGVPLAHAESEKLKGKHGKIGACTIDYLQLMEMPEKERKDLTVSETTRALKLMAKQTDAPVIAVSQLNRSVEQRSNKRPLMSDLRESGGIEQDADVIIFCYRDEYYDKSKNPGVIELIVAKNREGETGTCFLRWHGGQFRVSSLSDDDKAALLRNAALPADTSDGLL